MTTSIFARVSFCKTKKIFTKNQLFKIFLFQIDLNLNFFLIFVSLLAIVTCNRHIKISIGQLISTSALFMCFCKFIFLRLESYHKLNK